MLQLKHVQSALGWCALGLLLTVVLINVIGLISPFWGLLLHPDDPYASRNLLNFWQPITPWFSVCFIVAAWHLALAFQSMAARVCVIVLGILVPVAYIGSGLIHRALEQATAPASLELFMSALANVYLGLVIPLFIFLVWRAVRKANTVFNQTTAGEVSA